MNFFRNAFFLLVSLSCRCLLRVGANEFDAAWRDQTWTNASATFFGRDEWSLNIGSCGYGFVCPNRWADQLASGYDLAAVSDKSKLYSGSHTGAQCGRCLEVKCRDGSVKDATGGRYARQKLCKNNNSVKVKITDTCDCDYPKNRVSNARWCCDKGGETGPAHIDLSQWAIEKIVQDASRWGVFAIEYRPVDCNSAYTGQAPSIPLVESPHDGQKPDNLDCSTQSYNTKGTKSSKRRRYSSRRLYLRR